MIGLVMLYYRSLFSLDEKEAIELDFMKHRKGIFRWSQVGIVSSSTKISSIMIQPNLWTVPELKNYTLLTCEYVKL